MYNLLYMELKPKIRCLDQKTQTWHPCKDDIVCKSNHLKWEINWEAPTSLHNWVEDFNLLCESRYRIGLLGSINFVTLLLGLVSISRIADLKGRKSLFIVGMVLHILSLVSFFYVRNIE